MERELAHRKGVSDVVGNVDTVQVQRAWWSKTETVSVPRLVQSPRGRRMYRYICGADLGYAHSLGQ